MLARTGTMRHFRDHNIRAQLQSKTLGRALVLGAKVLMKSMAGNGDGFSLTALMMLIKISPLQRALIHPLM